MKALINILFQLFLFCNVTLVPCQAKLRFSNLITTSLKTNDKIRLIQDNFNHTNSNNSRNNESTPISNTYSHKPIYKTITEFQALKLGIVEDCNEQTCRKEYGKCQSESECICNEGYLNVPSLSENKTICDYQQKKQVTTFLLELFFMGTGHMYRGSVILGILKLLFIICFPCLLCCFVCMGIVSEADIKVQTCFLVSSITVAIVYVLGVIIWFLYDIANIGMNKYTDGNGYPLLHW